MERTLTAVATGLWVAPLVALGTLVLCYYLSPRTGGSDHDIAASMLAFVLGAAAFFAGFSAAAFVVHRYTGPQQLRGMQILAAVAITSLLGWAFWSWRATLQHDAPQYPGYDARLEVEIRAEKRLLEDRPMDHVFTVFFGNGEAEPKKFPELTSEEGDYQILPAELRVERLHDWSIVLMHTTSRGYVRRYWFQLDLPDVPVGNVPWSDWTKPIARKEYDMVDGVMLRYRWLLSPVPH